LEYGIDRPGEMDFILKIAHPDIGVFTVIDAVHSEQFGSPDEIAREEIKMALHTKELVFLNQDDPYAMQLLPRIQVDKITYQTQGYEQTADISFNSCDFVLGTTHYDIRSVFFLDIKGNHYQITTNLIGKANYGYIGVALAIVEILAYQAPFVKGGMGGFLKRTQNPPSFGHPPYEEGLLELNYELQPGRLSIFPGKYDSIIFDSTYNAAPLSMKKTIDTAFTIRAKLFPNSEIRLVLGDMRELGDLTEKEHRLLAGYVSQVADKLFLMGEQMTTHLADEIKKI
jgi:UDP-N-acetylmuramoyl-tripeptide--D-alanyl-D-alanine ligase